MRTIFLGTPALAVPFLEKLHQKTTVAGVITSPDQPAGRGYSLKAPEVKLAAQRLSLPVLQPESFKDPSAIASIRALEADVGIVVAYGKLLPQDVLSIPKYGFLNVHFSLLPKYRGAAPMQWALINGETKTGVTLFWLDEGMDTGPVFLQKTTQIQPEDNGETLRNKLVDLGVLGMGEVLGFMAKGEIQKIPQAGEASKAHLLKKENGRIDWTQPAQRIGNQIRGMFPWPGTYSGTLKVLKARVIDESKNGSPGTVIDLVNEEGPVVKCGSHSLLLLQVQPEGKKPMTAWSWWQGARLKIGDKIG